jgi:hypothetical protein
MCPRLGHIIGHKFERGIHYCMCDCILSGKIEMIFINFSSNIFGRSIGTEENRDADPYLNETNMRHKVNSTLMFFYSFHEHSCLQTFTLLRTKIAIFSLLVIPANFGRGSVLGLGDGDFVSKTPTIPVVLIYSGKDNDSGLWKGSIVYLQCWPSTKFCGNIGHV